MDADHSRPRFSGVRGVLLSRSFHTAHLLDGKRSDVRILRGTLDDQKNDDLQ